MNNNLAWLISTGDHTSSNKVKIEDQRTADMFIIKGEFIKWD